MRETRKVGTLGREKPGMSEDPSIVFLLSLSTPRLLTFRVFCRQPSTLRRMYTRCTAGPYLAPSGARGWKQRSTPLAVNGQNCVAVDGMKTNGGVR